MTSYIEDCDRAGLFDHLNSPVEFIDLMSHRHESTLEFYLAGISMLDAWYGDKAYRQYDAWFAILDGLFMQAENHFKGRFGNE